MTNMKPEQLLTFEKHEDTEFEYVENQSNELYFVYNNIGHLHVADTGSSYMRMSDAVKMAKWILSLPENQNGQV